MRLCNYSRQCVFVFVHLSLPLFLSLISSFRIQADRNNVRLSGDSTVEK